MFDPDVLELAKHVLDASRQNGMKITTAESCTGGLIAASLTAIAGSSDVFERGFVTYSNTAKSEMLGVPASLIVEQGAVSGAVACAMAQGAIENSNADIAVSCTGIAGPDGGTEQKPVGTVHLALAQKSPDGIKTEHMACDFGEQSRHMIQLLTLKTALELLVKSHVEGVVA